MLQVRLCILAALLYSFRGTDTVHRQILLAMSWRQDQWDYADWNAWTTWQYAKWNHGKPQQKVLFIIGPPVDDALSLQNLLRDTLSLVAHDAVAHMEIVFPEQPIMYDANWLLDGQGRVDKVRPSQSKLEMWRAVVSWTGANLSQLLRKMQTFSTCRRRVAYLLLQPLRHLPL